MPLSYEDVTTADLAPLLGASEMWQKMGERFGELKGHYEAHVQRALANGNWQGLALAAHQSSAAFTASEYAAAKAEALAVASLLKQAHTELSRLQKAVKDLVADAKAKDYKVDDSGKAVYVGFDKLSAQEKQALQHDPDYPRAVADAQQKAQEWTDSIAKAVQAVDEADQSIRRALTRAAGFGGFNADAEGDLTKAGVPEARATTTDGWKVTATGPAAGSSATGSPSYGKESRFKAYGDLGHVTAQRSLTDGPADVSVTADAYAGSRATANYGFSDKGVSAAAEMSWGGRGMIEVREDSGHIPLYLRADGFVGEEAGVSAKATKKEGSVGAKAFGGAKGGVAGGFEFAGIGIGGTAEGWAGSGAEGKLGYQKDDKTGKWKIGGKAGVAAPLGGALGVEITVDPDKFGKTVGHAAEAIGAGSIKNAVSNWF
ncbi:hypothetical protein B7P34_16715 [Streptosporangium nondiastaticum]|uniref:Uncharacterized protein n=1 Tax=Streptosporangium nondiastaticum TaxID=35764 RepID=A0A9X7JPW8_9ACTN|nr:hypothetical protein [Streptosporangium nondiastaticum]PSJ27597.1 hypothetical protein B7P34_16715 [Streptosporangium nondiastaticum]